MDDDSQDVVGDEAAGVFVTPAGEFMMVMPEGMDGLSAGTPDYVLAMAELLSRAMEEGVASLAEAFRQRASEELPN